MREPDNEHDKNAVMVWIDGKHVGYLPIKTNGPVADLIDHTGTEWTEPPRPLVKPSGEPMAADAALRHSRAIRGTFVRSPNSAYPQVQIED